MADLSGRSLGRYHLLEKLGEGGMAVVYKAFDTRLETDVAVKIIRTEKLTEETIERTRKRFNREAKVLANLTHPNIVNVTDFGEYKGIPYLVMPYLSGGTLKEQLGKPIDWNKALRILAPIARGLEYAHKRKIIHRDVKSSNIIMTDSGQPMLSDFGVAKMLTLDETADLTGTGLMGIGTPEYMAPEQWIGKATSQSDQYSLGVVLYEMLTGKKPFTAETPAAIILKQATEPLPPPSGFANNLPDKVEKILMKALALNPKDRYKDMGEFAKAMEGCLKMISPLVEWIKPQPVPKPTEITLDMFATEDRDRVKTHTLESALPQKAMDVLTSEKPVGIKKINLLGRPLLIWQMILAVGLLAFIIILYKVNIDANKYSTSVVLLPSSTAISNISQTSTTAPGSMDPLIKATLTMEPTSTSIPLTSTPVFEIGSTMISEMDGMVLAYVPAGKFTMGSNEKSDEQPIHQVGLDSFWIDQTEVTNNMYAKCVDAKGCELPKSLNSYDSDYYYGNVDFDNYPVVNINWNMAKTYCEWAGRNLPTEAQWEKAARGPDARTYPWGEGLKCVNVDYYNGVRFCGLGFSAVKSHPKGASLYGVYDMAGNVMEWVNSLYKPYPYKASDGREDLSISGSRVLRGGSGYYYGTDMRSANRGGDAQSSFSADIGFRCAITPK